MSNFQFPTNYLIANAENAKQISMVVTIQGLPFKLSNRPIYSIVRYGDPDTFYGQAGLVYGSLRQRADIFDLLSLDGSSLSISQTLEPEQGKASVSIMSLAFIDKNNIMTQVCSPGFYIPDILGANITVELGYQQISYPTDYFVIFRGFVSSITQKCGIYTFQLSDPILKTRQYIFLPGTTETSEALDATQTNIPLQSTAQLYKQILGPTNTYDPAITTYIQVDSEFMSYGPTGLSTGASFSGAEFTGTGTGTLLGSTISVFTGTTLNETITAVYNGSVFVVTGTSSGALGNATVGVPFTSPVIDFTIVAGSVPFVVSDTFTIFTLADTPYANVVRGDRNTTPAEHDLGATVTAFVQFQDHGIDMALKLMLSGWGGPWLTDVPIQALVYTLGPLGNIPNAILLPNNVDAINTYGLIAGDYITISGSGISGNNITTTIVGFENNGSAGPNQIILLATALAGGEYPTAAVMAFRSQFDTYPSDNMGMLLTPQNVNVQDFLTLKQQFLADSQNAYRFLISEQETGKDFMEMEIYLPMGCYSLTRRGLISIGITKPPLVSGTLTVLNQDNILDPQNIMLTRAVNNRKFFNEVNIQYDVEDDNSTYDSVYDNLDSNALTIIGVSSVLPITSLGLKTAVSPNVLQLLQDRTQFILSRYSRGAIIVSFDVMYGVGNTIEAGDVVGLDGTNLFLPNFQNGDRNFGVQLFEVTNRTLDVKQGKVSLQLTSGVGSSVSDRFGVVSPSSVIAAGSTTSQVVIQDSFSSANPEFPGNEPMKWANYLGQQVMFHDVNFTTILTATLVSFNPTNEYILNVSGLSSAPPAGYVMDIVNYPTDGNPLTDSIYKAIHFFLDYQVLVTAGVGTTQFQVASGDISKFFVGGAVRVHDYSFGIDSGDQTITDVDTGTNTITVGKSMGFTPSPGQFIELIGFADEGGAYRWI